MSDFSFMDKMKDEDAYLFKRCIRRLLDSTFIVADRDERLYEFISAEGNQYDINVYLGAIGYKVVVEDRMKVAMLQQADEDVDTVGLKRISLYRFNQKEIRLLLVVWMLFLERMGYAEPVFVTVGDIMDKCALYQIALTPAEIRGAYRVFKRFSLIDYNDDDITKEDGVIRLYPSLQFCMDIGQLKQVVADYVPDLSGEETDPGEGENPEDGTGAEGLPGEEPEGEEADE
ncbi:DUF4194 domain-containing protein [Lachnoclostridium sp. An76]|uniref:DUF4194 domain-containing protein n=1 Tax=Lachnoclostridium sp. An76 TaxID=1965654 RepID=UPI000B37C8C0|nr:DUF4194 domain-containing protein [Lachnoclostridium sp. An76]OUN36083.1 hypothetical protein B5G27_02735 [Lachnoclostridium sp. An76]